MKTITGDLLVLALNGHFDVIVHGCNCQCTMQRGIAGQIHKQFPEAYEADCRSTRGDRSKLGTFTFAEITRSQINFTIVNAYTQFDWRGTGLLADYDAIRKAFDGIQKRFAGRRIAYPRIGAGLAHGDWPTISAILDEKLSSEDHTLVKLEKL